jgi:hypothetical protein
VHPKQRPEVPPELVKGGAVAITETKYGVVFSNNPGTWSGQFFTFPKVKFQFNTTIQRSGW